MSVPLPSILKNSCLGLINLGIARFDLRDLKGAIEAYKRALSLNPQKAGAWTNLGNAHFDLKDLKEATAAYEQALTLDPQQPEAWNNLGVVYEERAEKEEALYCYERSAALGNQEGQKYVVELRAQGIISREVKLLRPL